MSTADDEMRDVAEGLVEDFVDMAALEVRVDLAEVLAGMARQLLTGV